MTEGRNGTGRRLVDIAGQFLQVKDWREFQHYHDRNPSWIKLHKKILDNAEYQRLPVASRALAPMLWLLASEHLDGMIPWAPPDIAWRLRMETVEFLEALEALMQKGFFGISGVVAQDASTSLALAEQFALTKKETEKETEKESTVRVTRFVIPSLGEVQSYCQERDVGVDAQKWFDYYTSNGWKVGRNPMRDWRAAVRTWEKGGNGNGKPEPDKWEAASRRVAERLGEED